MTFGRSPLKGFVATLMSHGWRWLAGGCGRLSRVLNLAGDQYDMDIDSPALLEQFVSLFSTAVDRETWLRRWAGLP